MMAAATTSSSDGEGATAPKQQQQQARKPTVAVIGGGIAGLSCARGLQGSFDVTVYDTGRLRPGGRASSRQPGDRPDDDAERYPLLSRFRFDHAAQFVTTASSSPAAGSWRAGFDAQVRDWIDRGVLREAPRDGVYAFEPPPSRRDEKEEASSSSSSSKWTARCLNPSEGGDDDDAPRFCYPPGGMSALAADLANGGGFEVRQDVWVSPSSGVRYNGPKRPAGKPKNNGASSSSSAGENGKQPRRQQQQQKQQRAGAPGSGGEKKKRDLWTVRAQGRTLGNHDHLVVAHNGKCADRLMSSTPAREVHRLLRTNFNDRVPADGGKKMTLNSLYSLTFAVKGPSILSGGLPEDFVGGFVEGHPRLGLVTCQTAKYPPSADEADGLEVWTVLSTASFAKKHKAPQEFLPDDVVEEVTGILLESLESDVLPSSSSPGGGGGGGGSLREAVLESRLQLWGAAVPLNVWRGASSSKDDGGGGFLHDAGRSVGVCGDWLLEASLAGAWTSGRNLAHHLVEANGNGDDDDDDLVVGLPGRFEASQRVRKLGLASLDGLGDDDQHDNDQQRPRSSTSNERNGEPRRRRRRGGRGRGGGGRGRGKNSNRRKPDPRKREDRSPVGDR